MARVVLILTLLLSAFAAHNASAVNFYNCTRYNYPPGGATVYWGSSEAGACASIPSSTYTGSSCVYAGGSSACGSTFCGAGKEWDGVVTGGTSTERCKPICTGHRHSTTGACITCDVDETWNPTTNSCGETPGYGGCPDGQAWDYTTNSCTGDIEPDCPNPGEVRDPVFDQCHPACEEGESWEPFSGCGVDACPAPSHAHYLPEGCESGAGVCVIQCHDPGNDPNAPPDDEDPNEPFQEVPPEETPECDVSGGYVDNTPLCVDQMEDCKADGGTVGTYGGNQVCIPPNQPIETPRCKANEVLTLISDSEMGCRPVDNSPSTPPDTTPNPIDKDNDDIPDTNDGDIDGDGTPNGSDSDADGDGIPNVDDPTPLGGGSGGGSGDGNGNEASSVSGGGSCTEPPECKGDAIQCAILRQGWETRCGTKLTGSLDCDAEPTCQGSEWQCAIELQNWRLGCAFGEGDDAELEEMYENTDESDLAGEPVDLGEMLSDVYAGEGDGGSCPAPRTITVMGYTHELSYEPLCEIAIGIRPFVIITAQFVAFIAIMRAF